MSKSLKSWWAMQGLNLRPHPCEGCALHVLKAEHPGMHREQAVNTGSYLYGNCTVLP